MPQKSISPSDNRTMTISIYSKYFCLAHMYRWPIQLFLLLFVGGLLSACVLLPSESGAAPEAVAPPPLVDKVAMPANQLDDEIAAPSIVQPMALASQLSTDTHFSEDPVIYSESTVTIPTYPYQLYQTQLLDPATQWPYASFDRERFLDEKPGPANKTYRSIVLENRYLELTILPELGGRLWQVRHKSSGNQLFYQNSVVKPSPWGPSEQLGWLALGGLEWNVPVVEHGYDWGTEWIATVTQSGTERATVTLSTPKDGRKLTAQISITLQAGLASFELQLALVNTSGDPLQFDYWHTAMFAPGPENSPSADLHFVLPTNEVIVHSTGDATLPPVGEPMTWPIYRSRNLSRLGNWSQYLGLFEYPSARGPFVGVYDRSYDAGGVRTYPAGIARGSKLFGLGWHDAISSDYFTDDGSAYVELHGGLAPSFFERAELEGHGSIAWRESWYPVQGIGDISYANELVAIHVEHVDSVLTVGLYPVLPIEGSLIIEKAGIELFRQSIVAHPDLPLNSIASNIPKLPGEVLDIRLLDALERELLSYTHR